MNFSRKTILVVGAALLAACGDKVTVSEYTPPAATSKVNSVEVAPATATLNIGQTITLTAAVNADAGLATTVTWSASAANVTVSSAGVVTAVTATPGVAVCATSTVDTGKKGCATIVVTPATAPAAAATVQINSITATGNLNATVNPLNVAGNIDVTLNVNPGGYSVDSIVLKVDGKVAGKQSFTAAQAAALRFAGDEAVATQTTFPQVVFTVNTAEYSVAAGSGATIKWLNGERPVAAYLYAKSATAPTTATVSQKLIFNNLDGFAITTSNTGTPGFFVNAAGYRWIGGGSLTVNAVPVMYSGSTVGTVNATLDANGGCAAVGALGSAAALTSGAYVITNALAGLWSNPATCLTTPNLITVTATNAAGDNLTLGGTNGVLNPQAGIRWDNAAPTAPALLVNLNGRFGSWINDAVVFNAVNAAASPNNWITAASVETGVGGTITYSVRASTTRTLAIAASPIANATSLAPSATNATYCALAYASDVLGNTSANPAACTTFGVDRANPTIAYSGGLAANAQLSTATIGGEFSVTVSDTGLVGNSGMQPVNPVLMQVAQRVAAGNGVGATNPLNADGTAATTLGVLAATGVNTAGNPIYTTAITGLTADAYYTYNATAYDAAGNSASVSARTIVLDNGALVVGNVSTPITVSTIGWTGSAFLNDALDIANYWFSSDYATLPAPFAVGPSVAPLRFAQAPVTVNGFNAASFLNTNYAVSQAINLPLALQAAGVLYPMSNINANATNVGNVVVNGASVATPAIAPALVVFAPTGLATFPAITNSIASNTISSGVTTAPTAANPATGTLTVTATGPTATFNNPFSRVDFYAVNNGGAAGTEWRLIGSTAVSSLVDVGAVRTFSWTLPISGATLYTQLGFTTGPLVTNVIAVGFNTAGTIGMINAAPYALTVIK